MIEDLDVSGRLYLQVDNKKFRVEDLDMNGEDGLWVDLEVNTLEGGVLGVDLVE